MKRILVLAALASAIASPALADREPTAEERARIEAALKAEGFTRWESIELEDDGMPVWEVDDAVAADGKEYDLDLDPTSLAIIKRDAD